MDSMATQESQAALPLVENVLLWSMRAWVIGHCRSVDVADRIGAVYAQIHAPEAAGDLQDFMHILCGGAMRTLEVNCVCCPAVSADESALLDVFALQQEHRDDEARALLCGMVSRPAATAGCQAASRLVRVLLGAGRSLPRASDALRRHAFLHHATAGVGAISVRLH